MLASKQELFAVLRQYNPWWAGTQFPELPGWHRAPFRELMTWVDEPPAQRALLISGARQVGKTTLMLQAIRELVDRGVPPGNILYATFDHPLFKLTGPEPLLRIWREFEPADAGYEYLFLDEIQLTPDWQTWVKHQVDFEKGRRRIAVTGSALPMAAAGQESGVGRWKTLRIPTLSFYEYLQLRKLPVPDLPIVRSLREPFEWPASRFLQVGEAARPLTPHFHEYLLRGGFPQSVLVDSIYTAQKLMREDIVDKVLKRDMTALFGVRRVLELEQVFLYLCLHDGGIVDVTKVSDALSLKRATVGNFLELLEATHLIYRLLPFGYGKQVLRGKPKVYLADPAIAPGVLLKGKALLDDTDGLGRAVEAAFFKHVFARYYERSVGFSYWRGTRDREVDIIAEVEGELIPFEVKYRPPAKSDAKAQKGLEEFCAEHKVGRGYIITREWEDFGVTESGVGQPGARFLRVPAALACYWLGSAE
jgi:predicted AAA+ superfamily ATPase